MSNNSDETLPEETLRRVAERFGTPTYLYDLGRVRAQVAELKRAVPSAQLFYAVKANPSGAIDRKSVCGERVWRYV